MLYTSLQACWNQTKMGLKVIIQPFHSSFKCLLKSDQDGIESQKPFSKLNMVLLSWNQTKMGLKGIYYFYQFIFVLFVEIRPRWDWKLYVKCPVGGEKLRWNQTKMGLKALSCLIKMPILSMKIVEIRPRWDWKWEGDAKTDVGLVWLKSDQDGIERHQLLSS